MDEKDILKPQVDTLFGKVTALIDDARKRIRTTINLSMVYTYFGIGQFIVEDELQGNYRATYGKRVLDSLSERLTARYGAGWSVETLRKCRQFYQTYSDRIQSTVSTESSSESIPPNSVYAVDRNQGQSAVVPEFVLDWSHYLVLMRVKDPNARRFYEVESLKSNWNVRQLQRQVASSLYERIALSRDKKEVMRLANEGNVIEEWTSTKEAYVLKNLRTDVTYTVHENAAPDGFAVAPETKLCIDSNNNVTFTGKKTTEGILLIEDARTSIKIAKVDKTSGEKVEGAKIQILDKEGIVFEEWRSGKEAHEVTGLKTGEIYILREIEAPVGYALAADTEFALKADGTIDMSKTTAVVENGEILIKDSEIRVTISLQDVNGNLIGGAVLKISYRNNKEVEGCKWTTVAGQDYTIIGLSAGKYYLYEVTTPAGYLKAARIPFEVDEYGRITRDGKVVSKIVMVNQKVSRSSNSGTSTRTTTERSTVTRTNDSTGTGKATTDRKVSSTRAKGAKTGDDNNTAIYLIMMALSAGAITAIAATKKKKRANG